jgi:hypothetical protein
MADDPRSPERDLTRREALKLGTAATAAVVSLRVAGLSAAASTAQSAPAFFTADELAMVDELSELIVPTDSHSPGAKAAKVAAYIDTRLADAFDEQDRTTWRDGLTRVDALSQQAHGASFLKLGEADRVDVLARMAANEANPQTPEERFFVVLKRRVVDAYYSSSIGIHQEMDYQGNVYQAEFAGTDVSRG